MTPRMRSSSCIETRAVGNRTISEKRGSVRHPERNRAFWHPPLSSRKVVTPLYTDPFTKAWDCTRSALTLGIPSCHSLRWP